MTPMPSFDQLLRRITPRHSVPAIPATPPAEDLGALPTWKLDDLYPGTDSPALREQRCVLGIGE